MLPFLHSLIKESECWRFTLPPSPLKVSLSQCSPYSLLPTLYPLLTHIWQRSGCVKVVWLPPPSYPHFFSRWVPSCSCLFSFSSPPCHPTHSFSLLDPPGKKKNNLTASLCWTVLPFYFNHSCSVLEGLPASSVGSVILMPTRLVERSKCLWVS